MSKRILVYWHGIVGIAGKGPAYIEAYDEKKTIGEVIQTMTKAGCGEKNKRIEIFKFEKGNMNKYDKNNPYWSHDTKLSDYLTIVGGWGKSNDLWLVYCIV